MPKPDELHLHLHLQHTLTTGGNAPTRRENPLTFAWPVCTSWCTVCHRIEPAAGAVRAGCCLSMGHVGVCRCVDHRGVGSA